MTSIPPPPSDHEEIRLSLGAFALDAVDGPERDRIQEHVATCPACRRELDALHDVAGRLADRTSEAAPAPPAPPHVWEDITGRLAGSPDDAAPGWATIADRLHRPGSAGAGTAPPAPTPIHRRPRRRAVWAVAAVAAALALVAVGLGARTVQLQHRVTALGTRSGLSTAEQAALAAPGTRRVVLTAATTTGSGPRVTVVLPRRGTGFVEGGALPALPADRTYQLWGISGGRAVSLGVLGPAPGVAAVAVGGTTPSELAITDEGAGGAVQPTSTPLVRGSVPA